ncbi:MAG TPA: class I SAM-dependent methyltransferase [Actinophytocola sp.]|uniref:THUMP-like domain-containing protein n=1 Tax=Actinophytocola sp. TaxID=1872138 RepID=UPI002DB801B2|nr:class I SAM-dependent methyltransferase [Actinophytocola sp.]HEU5470111.1 class I SAM-dependent methyltransferase [Actinophytocola sp.]
MSYQFSVADVGFLAAAAAEIAEVDRLPLTGASYLADVRTARGLLGDRAGAVLETVLLRRRAVSKVEDPGRWLFTDAALQQATPLLVARHRAARFAGRDVHDVTCSVGVDLAELAAVAGRCLGSDLDPVRLAMAAHNCPGVALARADALRPVSRGTAVFADPGRRDAAGRRRWRPADFAPPLDALTAAYPGRDLAVKCAPGIDLADVPWADEVEIVSLDGQVREACLWRGGLATARRRATVLRTEGPQWTITDGEPDDCPVRAPGAWIVDPDGAVVRAGLVRHYAARHRLGQLDERIAYLTGDTPPPGIRAFRVLEHGHYTEKALRAALRRLGIGRLEILVRGLDVDPNRLRPRLRLSGTAEASVVLTRVGRTPTAFLCRAERTS